MVIPIPLWLALFCLLLSGHSLWMICISRGSVYQRITTVIVCAAVATLAYVSLSAHDISVVVIR